MMPELQAWYDMNRRCFRSSTVYYADYGGRGIRVCQRWANSFEAFIEDMGHKPSPRHSLDRIDNDGDYEPGNCRWATWIEQERNRRNVRVLTFRGETRSLPEWADVLGVNRVTLMARISKLGWTVEKALATPVRQRKPKEVVR